MTWVKLEVSGTGYAQSYCVRVRNVETATTEMAGN